MTTPKKIGFWEEIHYHWVHARPHAKRVRLRLPLGLIGFLAAETIASESHFPDWLRFIFSSIPTIYVLREGIRFLAADFRWEAKEKDEQLGRLLASPDLQERFTALRSRLQGGDAQELNRLQEAMEFGAHEAKRLAQEIRKYEGITEELRERKEHELQAAEAAEALAKLLDGQGQRLARIIEHTDRRSQWMFVIAGAILGVAIQALAQWIF